MTYIARLPIDTFAAVKQPKLDEQLLIWVIDCDQKDIHISGELEARKRESDLRTEGLRYDNTLKRLKVVEENMLARKRLLDAGIPEADVAVLMPTSDMYM